jgi:hypothetical protein
MGEVGEGNIRNAATYSPERGGVNHKEGETLPPFEWSNSQRQLSPELPQFTAEESARLKYKLLSLYW